MKLTITLTDQRQVSTGHSYMQPAKFETYDRASMYVDGNGPIVAGALRALADEIDPSFALASDFEVSA